jgi:hypothetical protein
MRHRVYGVSTCPVLCFSGTVALGSSPSCDGLTGGESELQADLPLRKEAQKDSTVLLTLIEETVSRAGQQLASWQVSTTALLSGVQRCRRPYRFRRRKRNITLHRRWQSRSSICGAFSRTWISVRSQTRPYMKTTRRASRNHVIGGSERAKHIDIRKHFAHETI